MSGVVIGAYADAAHAVAALGGAAEPRRAAVLPRGAVGDGARLALRDAGIECLTTLEEGGPADAAWLARELAEAQGWRLMDGADGDRGGAAGDPGDVIGWYELRIVPRALTTDRPITRLHGARQYIASFNLLGQGRLNQRCGELLYERLADAGIAPDSAFDTVVCSESKAVGMVQVLVESFGLDRYVVLRKGLKNYMPRRPRSPLVEEAASITTAGAQSLVLDPLDLPLVEGRRVLLVDDVVATGGTVRAACRLLGRAGATVAATATVLLKGPEPEVPRLVVLARPLL
ncbi:MAG TPA: phosphoribosyltransferase family protein [Methylomirabilota bacterium]|nr:phosphoribosyltransferase family protein [Methylomirabilota bacterium]